MRRSPSKHAGNNQDLPQPKTEEFLEAAIGRTANPLVLVLDRVTDPHNLGACLRTANAAGAVAVVAPKDHSCTITETVVHVASGAAGKTPFVRVTNLARTLRKLQDLGLWLTATDDAATTDLYAIDLTGPTAIIMGAEGPGIRKKTRDTCDHLARLPMLGTVECLNVSVAAGVCLYEAVRQRHTASSTSRT